MYGYTVRVKRRATGGFGVALAKKAGDAGDGEIGLEEFLRNVEGARDGLGGEVAAADGTFHGGGPSGGGPIACEEQARSLRILRGAPFVDAGLGRSEEHTSELQSHSDLVCRLL